MTIKQYRGEGILPTRIVLHKRVRTKLVVEGLRVFGTGIGTGKRVLREDGTTSPPESHTVDFEKNANLLSGIGKDMPRAVRHPENIDPEKELWVGQRILPMLAPSSLRRKDKNYCRLYDAAKELAEAIKWLCPVLKAEEESVNVTLVVHGWGPGRMLPWGGRDIRYRLILEEMKL